MQTFFVNMDEDVKTYKDDHQDGTNMGDYGSENWLDEAMHTGELFPSHPIVRPCIEFGRTKRTENNRNCRNIYRASDSHSLEIFTVQCACKYPKLIGLSVMKECERINTAISILLSRFKVLPKTCYYDNGCNKLKSIVICTPWVNETLYILSDRFHYHSHKCDIGTYPDSYNWCEGHNSSNAESSNQPWKFRKSHVGFLSPDNFMLYLAIRSVFINVATWVREQNGTQEIEESHYKDYFRDSYDC